jgi:hypothetical protein
MATDELIDEILGEDEPATEPEVTETGVKEPAEADKPAPPADEVPQKTAEELLQEKEERLAELERVNNGLLQAKTSAMAKSNKYQEELSAKEERIRALEQEIALARATKPNDQDPIADQVIDKISIDFDEEGNAFVPVDRIPANKDLAKKIQDLEAELNATKHNLQTSKEASLKEEALNGFLSEKDGYKEAFPVFQEQCTYMSSLFDQFVKENEINFPTDKASALDKALEISTDPKFQTSFKAKYPNSDPEAVMQAYLHGSKHYTRKALNSIVGVKVPSSHKPLPDKPLPLATVAGASQAKDTESIDKYANMDIEDFLRMSPEEERRMNRLLKEKGI